MTNLSATKRDVAQLAVLLEQDFETSEEAARAVLQAAWELYEAKSKFIIAGQLYYSPQTGFLQPEDARALKVAFGPYSTETQARNAQETLLYSSSTHEEFRRWVLQLHHGTPAAWFRDRKRDREAASLEKTQLSGLPEYMKKEEAA